MKWLKILTHITPAIDVSSCTLNFWRNDSCSNASFSDCGFNNPYCVNNEGTNRDRMIKHGTSAIGTRRAIKSNQKGPRVKLVNITALPAIIQKHASSIPKVSSNVCCLASSIQLEINKIHPKFYFRSIIFFFLLFHFVMKYSFSKFSLCWLGIEFQLISE